MPNKKKYEKLKSDPIRYEKYLTKKREWMRKMRFEQPFRKLSDHLQKRTGVKVKPFDLWKIAKRQKLICPITGRKLTNENISIDHIVSRKRGGTNEINNFQLVDFHANLAKFTLTMDELLSLCRDIVNHHK
jgi:5-methylcytosine-specific restriction endonuclease McrA